MSLETTEDAVLGGKLILRQPRRGHRFGHDAILLAAATAAAPGEHAVDLGSGVGTAGLALAWRVPDLAVTLVDINESLVALAAENARRNGLAERVRAISLDVAGPASAFAAAGLAPASADRVLMNPPFNDPDRQQVSPDRLRREAHAASRDRLAIWVNAANRLLRPDGTLTLIFRADGLNDVRAALDADFGAVTMLPVLAKPAAAAIRVLVRAVKGSRLPLILLPGFTLNGEDGKPSAEAEAVLRQGAALPFASLA